MSSNEGILSGKKGEVIKNSFWILFYLTTEANMKYP